MVSEHASPLAALGGVDAGGQNVYVAALARELSRRGLVVTVYTRRDDPGLDRTVVLEPGLEVVHLDAGPPRPLPKDLIFEHLDQLGGELAADLERTVPDVLHAHFWMSGAAAVRAASRSGSVAVVQTFHALGVVKRRHLGSEDSSPIQREAVEHDLANAVDGIVATCSDEAAELARLGAELTKVSVVPCGVDLGRFFPAPAASAERGRRRASLRMVAVSRLVERKGLAVAIEACAQLHDVELVIAGGPPKEALSSDPEAMRLKKLARRLGVDERVVFTGRLDRRQVSLLLRSADVAVSVPRYEPFGMVLLEAMACGVPVVASSVGGHIDTVVDGETGFLVPPDDPVMVANVVSLLGSDPALRLRFGTAARERACRHYSWSTVADGVLAAYGAARAAKDKQPAAAS